MTQHHAPVRSQATCSSRIRTASPKADSKHLCPHHFHVAPRGERFRGCGHRRSADADMLGEAARRVSVYQKSVPLPPGMYRLNVVAKDITGGNMNNYEMALQRSALR